MCRSATPGGGSGYGLSDDGMWRMHTWLISFDSRIVETTVAREAYFGGLLREDAAERFYRHALGPDAESFAKEAEELNMRGCCDHCHGPLDSSCEHGA
jgi:hypothetical protein